MTLMKKFYIQCIGDLVISLDLINAKSYVEFKIIDFLMFMLIKYIVL